MFWGNYALRVTYLQCGCSLSFFLMLCDLIFSPHAQVLVGGTASHQRRSDFCQLQNKQVSELETPQFNHRIGNYPRSSFEVKNTEYTQEQSYILAKAKSSKQRELLKEIVPRGKNLTAGQLCLTILFKRHTV